MDRKFVVVILVLVVGSIPILWYVIGFEPLQPVQGEETVRSITLLDQAVVVFTAFVIKPLYMLISFLLAWRLRKLRAHDLNALRWGLLAFLIGEAFCAINFLVFQDKSVLSEYLHNYGMVVSFGFMAYALLDGLDGRIIQISDPQKRCSLISLCGACVKTREVECRARQVFQLTSLFLGLLALIPLASEIREISYYSSIFGTHFNFTRLRIHQLFEVRYSPLVALLMLISAFFDTLRPTEKQISDLARIFLSAGVGALGFSLFRLFFGSVFAENLAWASSWEEITEFMLMVGIAYILWLFGERLGVRAAGARGG